MASTPCHFRHVLGQPLIRAGRTLDHSHSYLTGSQIAQVPFGRVRSQAPSRPLPIVSPPLPLRSFSSSRGPCRFDAAPSGSGPHGSRAGACTCRRAAGERARRSLRRFMAMRGRSRERRGRRRPDRGCRSALRVHVDQAHLHGGERVFRDPVAGIAVCRQAICLRCPSRCPLRLPDVLASAGPKPKVLKPIDSKRSCRRGS